jgi:flagellar biogenesis protein FliO
MSNVSEAKGRAVRMADELGGIAGWLMKMLRGKKAAAARLALVERITLAPRQSLALIEAEGRRILVATSQEGAPAFFSLNDSKSRDERPRAGAHNAPRATVRSARVSW